MKPPLALWLRLLGCAVLAIGWLTCFRLYSAEANPPAPKPATACVLVRDAEGAPLAGATVTLRLCAGERDLADGPALRKTTDAKGEAVFEVPIPPTLPRDGFQFWQATVGRDGYLTERAFVPVKAGVRMENQVTLQKAVITRLKLLDINGQPVRNVNVMLREPENCFARTDADGLATFAHSFCYSPAAIKFGPEERLFRDAPEVTIRLKPGELEAFVPARRISGQLLLPDGRPATGWFIAPHAVLTRFHRPAYISGANTKETTYTYTAPELVKVGQDGSFSLELAEEILVIVSPQGIPFHFQVQPRSWSAEPRRQTIRIPPVRRTHPVALVHADGTPAVGIGIGYQLENDRKILIGRPESGETLPPVWALAAEGRLVDRIVTDGDGVITLPVYYGGKQAFERPFEKLLPPYGVQPLTTQSKLAVWENPSGWSRFSPVSGLRKITLLFADQNGRSIPDMRVSSCVGEVRGQSVQFGAVVSGTGGGGATVVCAGTNVGRVSLIAVSSRWNVWSTSFRLDTTGDETVRLVAPEELRRQPLRGQLLVGKTPVPGVDVFLVATNLPRTGGRGRGRGAPAPEISLVASNVSIPGCPPTQTDAEGRFQFEHAPDTGTLSFFRLDAGAEPLPGWIAPQPFTATNRDLVCRLESAGSVVFRLPPGLAQRPAGLGLRRLSTMDYNPIVGRGWALDAAEELIWPAPDYYWMEYGSNSCRAEGVRPGNYEVGDKHTLLPFGRVVVQAGAEVIFNWSGEGSRGQMAPPQGRVEVKVLRGGRPYGGATVTFIQERRFGGPVVSSDLSDDDGHAWFSARLDQECAVAARVPGSLLGWRSFTLVSNQLIQIDLQPARMLAVKNGSNAVASVRVSFPKMASPEETALRHALGWENFFYTGPSRRSELVQDAPSTFVAEDLPVGQVVRVVAQRWWPANQTASCLVPIEAGQGPAQEIVIREDQFRPASPFDDMGSRRVRGPGRGGGGPFP